jgi:endonuclease/exonuclease/phosphatase family metal-dependent hydrolase
MHLYYACESSVFGQFMKKFFLFLFLSGLTFAAKAQSVKLMTYNLRLSLASDGLNSWAHRKDFMVDQINFYAPDIMGTQEGLPGQVHYLKKHLKNYDYIGIGREGSDEKGEHAAVFYNTDRFRVLKHHTFWLSQTPGKMSKGWDAAYLRICTYGLFQNKKNAKQFWVFNIHLDNKGEVARRESVKLILRTMKEVNTRGLPVILMGDFNSLPGSDVMKELSKHFYESRRISKTAPFGPEGTFNNFEFGETGNQRIDYIMIEKKCPVIVKKYAVLRNSRNHRYPSDHFPVYAEVVLGN